MKKKKKEKKIPVMLLEDFFNLGQRGEVVTVKPGFYSYLLRNKKAVLATKEKIKSELKTFILPEKLKSRQTEVQKLKQEIENLVFEFKLKFNDKGKAFNPLTKEKIFKFLKEKGFKIAKSNILIEKKLVEIGEFTIPLNLGYNIFAKLKVKISKN